MQSFAIFINFLTKSRFLKNAVNDELNDDKIENFENCDDVVNDFINFRHHLF